MSETENAKIEKFGIMKSGFYLGDCDLVTFRIPKKEELEGFNDITKTKMRFIVFSIEIDKKLSQVFNEIFYEKRDSAKIILECPRESQLIELSENEYNEIKSKFDNSLKEIENEKEEKKEQKRKILEQEEQKIFQKAKETGERQLISQCAFPCQDRDEECDLDVQYKYALPNGEVEYFETHTW